MFTRRIPQSRWSVAAIASVATLLLAGCSAASGPVNSADADGWSQKYDGTELHVLGEATLNSSVLESLLPDFKKKTGISVVLEQAAYDQVVQKSVLDYSTKKGNYDVVSLPYEYLGGFAEKKYLRPIDDLVKANADQFGKGFDTKDLLPELWKASSTWDGTTYGFPSNSATTMMMYRKDLFEDPTEKAAFRARYGYDLAPAKTFTQYRDIAEFFDRPAGATAAGKTLDKPLYGTAMAGKRHVATVLEWMNYSWAFGGDIFNSAGMPAINSKENVASLEYEVGLGKFAPPSYTTATWDEVTSQLQQGVAVQSLTWGDTAGSIEDAKQSAVAGKMGYSDIPVNADGATSHSHLGSWTYTINTDSRNADASMLFLSWASSAPVQKKLAEAGGLPAVRSVFEDPNLTAELPYWKQELKSLTAAKSRPRIPQWGAMSDSLALELSQVFAGSAGAQQALDSAQQKAESLLNGALPVTKF